MLQNLGMLTSSLCTAVTRVGVRGFSASTCHLAKRWKEKQNREYQSEFHNPVRQVAGMDVYEESGFIYDNKPAKIRVEKYVEYVWCGCGFGRTCQPFCDMSCKQPWLKKIIKGGPVRYIAPETKDIWFCNCKQTANRPFCDGTHRSEEVTSHKLEYQRQLWEPKEKK